jgi:hypothetical protein
MEQRLVTKVGEKAKAAANVNAILSRAAEAARGKEA